MLGWLFTWILSASGFALGWFNPFYGLMVYYALAILRPTFLWFWSFDPYNTPRFSLFVGLSTLAGWAFNGLGDWTGLRGVKLAIGGLVCYVLCGVVGWQLVAIAPDAAIESLELQGKIVIMALATLTLVRDARAIKIFAWVIVATLGYTALTLNEWYQINPNYLHNHGFGSIDNNGTAMIMVMAVPMSFFMGIFEKRIWVKALCFLSVALEVHVILFSFSRGSQLGLCIVGGFIFLFTLIKLPRKFLTITLTLLFVALTMRLAGEQVRERFRSIFAEERDASAESRFTTWNAAIQCMMQNPLGVGPRNFGYHSVKYGLSPGKAVHNLFFQTGADYGIMGMFALITFYVATFISTFKSAGSRVAGALGWPRFVGLAVCTSLGGFLICSIFIGMENVEVAYMVGLIGLTVTAYVNRVADACPAIDPKNLPEMVDVPLPDPEAEEAERQRHGPPSPLGGLRPAWQ